MVMNLILILKNLFRIIMYHIFDIANLFHFENFVLYRKSYIEALYKLGLVEEDLTFCVLTNIALATAFCRIYYRRKPGNIPGSMPGRAAYWRKYYNTAGGAGSVDHYIAANMGAL